MAPSIPIYVEVTASFTHKRNYSISIIEMDAALM